MHTDTSPSRRHVAACIMYIATDKVCMSFSLVVWVTGDYTRSAPILSLRNKTCDPMAVLCYTCAGRLLLLRRSNRISTLSHDDTRLVIIVTTYGAGKKLYDINSLLISLSPLGSISSRIQYVSIDPLIKFSRGAWTSSSWPFSHISCHSLYS